MLVVYYSYKRFDLIRDYVVSGPHPIDVLPFTLVEPNVESLIEVLTDLGLGNLISEVIHQFAIPHGFPREVAMIDIYCYQEETIHTITDTCYIRKTGRNYIPR